MCHSAQKTTTIRIRIEIKPEGRRSCAPLSLQQCPSVNINYKRDEQCSGSHGGQGGSMVIANLSPRFGKWTVSLTFLHSTRSMIDSDFLCLKLHYNLNIDFCRHE